MSSRPNGRPRPRPRPKARESFLGGYTSGVEVAECVLEEDVANDVVAVVLMDEVVEKYAAS